MQSLQSLRGHWGECEGKRGNENQALGFAANSVPIFQCQFWQHLCVVWELWLDLVVFSNLNSMNCNPRVQCIARNNDICIHYMQKFPCKDIFIFWLSPGLHVLQHMSSSAVWMFSCALAKESVPWKVSELLTVNAALMNRAQTVIVQLTHLNIILCCFIGSVCQMLWQVTLVMCRLLITSLEKFHKVLSWKKNLHVSTAVLSVVFLYVWIVI